MPAYLARFMQGLVAGAVKNGFPRQAANELTRQGIQGSLVLIQANSSLNLADFCEQVISPGGTTAQAMHVLDQRAFNAILTEAMEAALAQTQKLNR
jgi:pyrroline-5-carboxylate reductase